jgi:hypothetical protein
MILVIAAASLYIPVTAEQRSVELPGIGTKIRGIGLTITNLDKKPKPEMILMAYDISRTPADFIYRIGWNLDETGTAAGWSNDIKIPGVSFNAQGAGVSTAQLDKDPRPELILMCYNYIADVNTFRYLIGWNLGPTGETLNWSNNYVEVKGVGWEGSGAGIAVSQLDNNPAPELILMAYDNSYFVNFFRYRIGWNLDPQGKVQHWSNYQEGLGVGWEGSGAGMSMVQLDQNPRPDMLLLAYDNFPNQPPFFSYRVGWNLDSSGKVDNWSEHIQLPPVPPGVIGADIDVFNLDTDARPEFIVMAYHVNSANTSFVYRVFKNMAPARKINLVMDKLENVPWPPDHVTREGAKHSLRGIFALAGIDIKPIHQKTSIPDFKLGKPYTDEEIHCLVTAHAGGKGTALPGAWSMPAALLTSHIDGIPGMMFNIDGRKCTVVFANQCKDNATYLRTMAQQVGQALNLRYSDGDAWQGCLTYRKGSTLMNPTWKLAANWNFTWSAASLSHFYHHLLNQWQPGKKGKFMNCH